jgi:ankyrin repeat protein
LARDADTGHHRKEIVMSGSTRYAAPTRRLPAHPNLQQLRKQAKDLLERYQAGDAAATSQVETFERNPSRSQFALADAQRVLARAYGFESWPKLKAFVDSVNVARLADAVNSGDLAQVRSILAVRPELVAMDLSQSDEHRALHYAVLRRDPAMVRLLMEQGADARKGIYPHRDATSALAIARDREYHDVVTVIDEQERLRLERVTCPNTRVSPLQDELTAAIAQDDVAACLNLMEADRSLIQACGRDGATPLHIAAANGNPQVLAWLLDRGVNPTKRDLGGLTALDRAALAAAPGNRTAQTFSAISRLLVEKGAEITLRAAVALGDAARVRDFIRANPRALRQVGSSGGLLTLAVKHHQLDIVRLLLDLGADVDERTVLEELEDPTYTWGMPLWHAALAGNLEIARLLLDRGADPNANVYASGWPLRNAWHHGHEAVRRLLLDRGAKPQPYMIAEMHDIAEAERLLAADAGEELARELAWSAADHGCPEIVALALPRLDWPRNDRRWHWVLIQPIRGAGPDSANNDGHFRCMAALLQHGVDPNVTRFGQTALHFAAAYRGATGEAARAHFAALLLDHGARLDLRDDLLKSTPLGWACRWGRKELTAVLLQRGAPAAEPDAEPWAAPQSWARKMGHHALLAMLEGR